MNIKSILIHTVALISTISPAIAAPATQKPISIATKLVYPNGKPALDAVMIFDLVNNKTKAVTTTTYKPDSTGLVSFTLDRSVIGTSLPVLYISSPTGVGFLHWSDPSNPDDSTVEPYTSVRVHVVDSTGKPIAHATIAPSMFRMGNVYGMWNKAIPNGWTQITDANGYATLTKLPQGFSLELDVDDPNYAPPDERSAIQLANAAASPDAVLQLNPGAKITGTVIFSTTNAPVVGAEVVASPTNNQRGRPAEAITDSTGAYTLTRLNSGTYSINLVKTDEKLKDWVSPSKIVPVATAQNVTGVTIALIHGGIVNGKIVDKNTGKGVPNVMVVASSGNGQAYDNDTSDADGNYTFHLAPGSYDIRLNNQMSADQDEQYRHFQIQDEETQTFNFHVIAPNVVHGIVLGPDGKPVAGADVTTTDIENGQQKLKTDDQGHFAFDSPGLTHNANIFARSGDLATATPYIYTGDDNITLHLAANALVTLTGQVTDKSGQPIPNAKLNLILWGTNEGAYVGKSTTDAQGHYTFSGAYANAKYSVDSKVDGFTEGNTATLPSGTGPTLQMPAIVMAAATGFVGGNLLDVKGNPIVGATISQNSDPDNKTTTDASGHFMLKGLSSGPYQIVLTIQTADGRSDYPQLEPGKTNVTLYMPSPVSGVVVGPDNNPIAGAKVDANVDIRGIQTFETDSTGHFSIDSPGLKPKAALMARTTTMATASPVIYNGEDTLTIHVVPSALCVISGKVVDSDGNPVGDAKVELYRSSGDVGGVMGDVQTDANGQFAFSPVYAQSKYGISVSKQGYGRADTRDLFTSASPTLQVPQITLPIADAIAGGTVVDYKGTPVAGATITDQDISSITATTDQSGHFTLQNVPRGKTDIYAQAPDGTGGEKDLLSGRGDNIVYLDKPETAK